MKPEQSLAFGEALGAALDEGAKQCPKSQCCTSGSGHFGECNGPVSGLEQRVAQLEHSELQQLKRAEAAEARANAAERCRLDEERSRKLACIRGDEAEAKLAAAESKLRAFQAACAVSVHRDSPEPGRFGLNLAFRNAAALDAAHAALSPTAPATAVERNYAKEYLNPDQYDDLYGNEPSPEPAPKGESADVPTACQSGSTSDIATTAVTNPDLARGDAEGPEYVPVTEGHPAYLSCDCGIDFRVEQCPACDEEQDKPPAPAVSQGLEALAAHMRQWVADYGPADERTVSAKAVLGWAAVIEQHLSAQRTSEASEVERLAIIYAEAYLACTAAAEKRYLKSADYSHETAYWKAQDACNAAERVLLRAAVSRAQAEGER